MKVESIRVASVLLLGIGLCGCDRRGASPTREGAEKAGGTCERYCVRWWDCEVKARHPPAAGALEAAREQFLRRNPAEATLGRSACIPRCEAEDRSDIPPVETRRRCLGEASCSGFLRCIQAGGMGAGGGERARVVEGRPARPPQAVTEAGLTQCGGYYDRVVSCPDASLAAAQRALGQQVFALSESFRQMRRGAYARRCAESRDTLARVVACVPLESCQAMFECMLRPAEAGGAPRR